MHYYAVRRNTVESVMAASYTDVLSQKKYEMLKHRCSCSLALLKYTIIVALLSVRKCNAFCN